MLHPKETDLLGLFLVFVVLPIIAYVLLGKWSEVSEKKEKIRVLAQIAAQESLRTEAMVAAIDVPIVSVSKINNGFHECASCFSPATTRCSRCKTVRYCSGKCQILHWRQVHKHECQLSVLNNGCSSPKSASNEELLSAHEQVLLSENLNSHCFESGIGHEISALHNSLESSSGLISELKPRRNSCKTNREVSTREDVDALDSLPDSCSTSYDNTPFKETHIRHKSKRSHPKEVFPERNNADIGESEHEGLKPNSHYNSITTQNGAKSRSYSSGNKLPKLAKPLEFSKDQTGSRTEDMGCIAGELDASQMSDVKGSGIISKGFMKMIGLRKSTKHARVETSEVNGDKHKKLKMLFPYDEFLKYFQHEGFDFFPRGLVNCGNSCYANAVMQCLMSTKPLTIYLLQRSHSRTCCAKSWCLMCELEHYVTTSSGEPLSLSSVLLHIRSVNCQIGDGSQEDAHEFLRLLITTMQSICLERLGGERAVDPLLQETTFIQHTFGGQLRSKVKCLKCHHESDKYENFMDLNLEIFGRVDSLEDALAQFTSPEDLDGENKYRCGRCGDYVRARKQLAIHEAPNILTIVLKRFQKGSYGKLNKCITYPEMLDMIPFMTGKDDIPPLYSLYGVVVHLDTMNASFSGHYISYVKDLQGNWSKIDDAQVHQVHINQVMSEGAYILFYMRSSARQPSYNQKHSKHQTYSIPKSKPPKSTLYHHQESTYSREGLNENSHNFTRWSNADFSDAASSDWSIFTSSDDASFTTESTRDSFSTVDYTDNNTDPFTSIFNTLYNPHDYLNHSTVSRQRCSKSRAHTRFIEKGDEEKRSFLKSYETGNSPYRLHNTEKACCSSSEAFSCSGGSNHCGLYT